MKHLSRCYMQYSVRPFSVHSGFPKHKELFTDDYFEQEDPYQTNQFHGNDEEKFDEATTRMTKTGILSNYKKQLNVSAQDIVEQDFWRKMTNTTKDMAKQLRETNPSTYTQAFTTRHRLSKDPLADMPKRGGEYGNYERFSKNSVTEDMERGELDWGNDKIDVNFQNMIRQMSTQESREQEQDEKERTIGTVTDENVPTANLMQEFLVARNGGEAPEFELEAEKL